MSDDELRRAVVTLSHELRNSLASIRTAVDLLRDAGDEPAIAEKALGILARQVVQLTRLLDDLPKQPGGPG